MTEPIKDIQKRLLGAVRDWAGGGRCAPAVELRREAIQLNHQHYLESIPVYQELAGEEGYGPDADVDTIKQKLMLATEVFKSYQVEWLEGGDFGAMTRWLGTIYHKRLDADMVGVDSIEGWIERLGNEGVDIVYSSGTSGCFSFVPRDKGDRELVKTANIACLAPLLARRETGRALPRQLFKSATRLMPTSALVKLAGLKGLADFDAAFLGFRRGRMGNQVLIEEFAPLFRRHYFLYENDISGDVLRLLQRGAKTEAEQKMLNSFRGEVVGGGEENYLRVIKEMEASTGQGQKLFIFGAPYQFRELGEVMGAHHRRLKLKEGSLILFGGGWKSLTGETVAREVLVGMLSDSFGVPPSMIMEGYAMTEINMLMLRCERGRFHIPPNIEPVIYAQELNPMAGKELRGIFGFLDPLALSYPGFIISGDYVTLLDGECGCGLSGPALTEIGRVVGQDVKGCGGIMGSIRA